MSDDDKRFCTAEAIAQHLTEALASGDAQIFLLALRDVVTERNVGHIAQVTGLSRGGLYKMLGGGQTPRLDTVLKIVRALGVRLTVAPIS